MEYRQVKTSPEVWAVTKIAHPDLVVFSSYSAPDGDFYGNPDVCKMFTEYGLPNSPMPLIGAETTCNRNPDRAGRENEQHRYWFCIPLADE